MNTRVYLAFLITICAVSVSLQAYSMPGVNSLLSEYGVPNSIISGLAPVNITHSGDAYVALYRGGALYFLVNVTDNTYSFVLNSTSIYNVIKDHVVSDSLQRADFATIASQMHAYQKSSASQINDCLTETGIAQGSVCTLANYCYSCQEIPVCKRVLDATGGPSGVLGKGIATFEIQYDQLNQSFNTFYAAVAALDTSNAQLELARMNGAFDNISSITQVMYQNSIFPPTEDITPGVIANCVYYISSSSSPWYCTALGFCANLNYNYTKLDYIRALLNNLNALPLSDSQIRQIAANTSSTQNLYVGPILLRQKQALLARMLNASLPGYGLLVNSTGSLLSHVSNASLSGALVALRSSYANVLANYATANLVLANRTLSAQYATLAGLYGRVNATYSSLTGQAANNTEKLIELQMKGGVSPDVANLAFDEFALNNGASASGLGSLATLNSEAGAIAQKLSSYSTSVISLVELARALDRPFITLAASGLSYSSAVSLAPALGALLSLIIGAAVFVLILVYRSRLHRHRKVVLNERTKKNWRIIFAFLLVLIMLYALATYVLLSYASSSAPFGAVRGALDSSKRLVIAINGTPTTEEYACANSMRAALLAENRTATIATFTNGLCNAESLTGSIDSCMSVFADTGVPVVVLTETSAPGISAYSLYGSRLDVSGPAWVMNDCYAKYMVE